jgi:hypothetical protein
MSNNNPPKRLNRSVGFTLSNASEYTIEFPNEKQVNIVKNNGKTTTGSSNFRAELREYIYINLSLPEELQLL